MAHSDPGIKLPSNATPEQREAAERIDPASNRGKVMNAIWAAGARGLTDEEIEQATGMSGNSVRPARLSLHELGLIHRPAEGRSFKARKLKSGNKGAVWVATMAGGAAKAGKLHIAEDCKAANQPQLGLFGQGGRSPYTGSPDQRGS